MLPYSHRHGFYVLRLCRHGLYACYSSKNHIPSCWQVCLILCSLRLLLRDETLCCFWVCPWNCCRFPREGSCGCFMMPWAERQGIVLIKLWYTLIILMSPIITPGPHAWWRMCRSWHVKIIISLSRSHRGIYSPWLPTLKANWLNWSKCLP